VAVAELAAQKVAVVGAGWAGCAAAVEACRLGHRVTLYEASHHPGGRARRLEGAMRTNAVDNGQHILIGAYTETLALMDSLGVRLQDHFVRTPLQLQDVQGRGLQLPSTALPPALAVAMAVLSNREWRWSERLALMGTALRWRLAGFSCPEDWTVARLCRHLPEPVMRSMIEPLCVSALNTPIERASARVFLRVLRDAMFVVQGGSDLLIPTADLSTLLPLPALAWLTAQGATVHTGTRVTQLTHSSQGWHVQLGRSDSAATAFDAIILALPHQGAAQLIRDLASSHAHAWLQCADALQDEPIATVYVRADTPQGPARLPQPMLRLTGQPVQFMFDRSQLGNVPGTLALVASAPDARWPDNESLTRAALAQASAELAPLGITRLTHLQTVVEKRATFACIPGLQKPSCSVSPALPGLRVCGDYVQGPYPATLEAAVRSGLQAARSLN
jgi:squalene-associated FAD-dependent desaturase